MTLDLKDSLIYTGFDRDGLCPTWTRSPLLCTLLNAQETDLRGPNWCLFGFKLDKTVGDQQEKDRKVVKKMRYLFPPLLSDGLQYIDCFPWPKAKATIRQPSPPACCSFQSLLISSGWGVVSFLAVRKPVIIQHPLSFLLNPTLTHTLYLVPLLSSPQLSSWVYLLLPPGYNSYFSFRVNKKSFSIIFWLLLWSVGGMLPD